MAVDRPTYASRHDWFGTYTEYDDLGADLKSDLKSAQSFIPLDICAFREISANAIQNLAAHGGILGSDSTPVLERVDGATDRALRIRWAADDVAEIAYPPIPLPPDLNPAANVIVHLMLARSGATDDCQIDVLALENGVGAYAADVEMGGKTAALATTNVTEATSVLSASGIAGHPSLLNLSLLPDAHAADAIYLFGGWIEFTRMLRTS